MGAWFLAKHGGPFSAQISRNYLAGWGGGFLFPPWGIEKPALPESSSSSQGISLKGWAVSAGNEVASDSRYGTTCLFQASGLLLYFSKSIRSEVLHFQLPLTQIYYLLVILQTEFLLQRFSQNCVYLWLHCNSCLCLGRIPHFSVYFLSLKILFAPSILSSLSPKKTFNYF